MIGAVWCARVRRAALRQAVHDEYAARQQLKLPSAGSSGDVASAQPSAQPSAEGAEEPQAAAEVEAGGGGGDADPATGTSAASPAQAQAPIGAQPARRRTSTAAFTFDEAT